MKNSLRLFSFLLIVTSFFCLLSCDQITEPIEQIIQVKYIVPIWKGSLATAPETPEAGWAYYNTTVKKSFIFDGSEWQIMAQDGADGLGIIWKGELPSAPSNPKLNWAYYNTIDGNSYIYNGSSWDYLAKSGRDGASGILFWLGSFSTAPNNPSDGWAYYNSTDGISYIYSNGSWQILSKDGNSITWKGALTLAPSSPEINWAYFNTASQTTYIWNGSSWNTMATSVGGNTIVTVSITWLGTFDSAPLNPSIGNAYYNSTIGSSYVFDGSVWQQISKDGTNGTASTITGYLITWKGSHSSAPSNPKAGWAYYNSSAKKSYIYDGSSWQIMAQDGISNTSGGSGSTTTPSNYLYVILYTSKGNYIQYATQSITEVDFGQIGIGSTIKSTTFYIGINGTSSATLNLTGNPAIQISGANSDQFVITQPSVKTVNNGSYIMDACIAFKPTSIGEKTATITIPNDSPDIPNFSFTVKGYGSYWPKTFDGGEGDGRDGITCAAEDSVGNLYLVGYGFELVNDHSGFDWWIKKFDKNGVEDITNWNKKLNYYDDDYNSSYPTYDNPKLIKIDESDNVYIASSDRIIKFSSSGDIIWEKLISNYSITNIYIDLHNTVYVQTTANTIKFDSSGNEIWSNSITTKIIFDNEDNLYTFDSNTYKTYDSSGTLTSSVNCVIDEIANANSDGWINGEFKSYDAVYYILPVVKNSIYEIYMDNSSQGTGSKTARTYLSAYYDNNVNIFSNIQSSYSTPQKFTANRTGNVIIKMIPYSSSSSYYGTYAIKINAYTINASEISTGWIELDFTKISSSYSSKSVIKNQYYVLAVNDINYGDGTQTGSCKFTLNTLNNSSGDYWNSPYIFQADQTKSIDFNVTKVVAGKLLYYFNTIQPTKISTLSVKKDIHINDITIDSQKNVYVCGYVLNKINQYSKKDSVIKKYISGQEDKSFEKIYDWGHCEDEVPDNIYFHDSNIVVIGNGNDLLNGASANDTWLKILSPNGSLINSFEIDYENGKIISFYNNKIYIVSGNQILLCDKYGNISKSFTGNSVNLVSNYDGSIYVAGNGSNLISPKSSTDWQIIKY